MDTYLTKFIIAQAEIFQLSHLLSCFAFAFILFIKLYTVLNVQYAVSVTGLYSYPQ